MKLKKYYIIPAIIMFCFAVFIATIYSRPHNDNKDIENPSGHKLQMKIERYNSWGRVFNVEKIYYDEYEKISNLYVLYDKKGNIIREFIAPPDFYIVIYRENKTPKK